MNGVRRFILGVTGLLLASLVRPQVAFPAGETLGGWTPGASTLFKSENLYNYIDGGAELFLEFGFVELQLQKYRRAGDEIALEAYRMESPEAALGIYLLRCGRETPLADLGARHSGDRYQILAVKGDYFLQANNFNGSTNGQPAMLQLLRLTLAAIPAGQPLRLLEGLPAASRVPGSELLIRGPYGLQALYTLGEGDMLLLAGKVFALAADYRDESGALFTRILAPYPDSATARQAFDHLQTHLDSRLTILEHQPDAFVFRDFANRYGRVTIAACTVDITIKLVQKPNLQNGGKR